MTHNSYSDEELKKLGISPGLVRMSIGIENKDDLVNDFSKSLELLERG
jgi:cystathionine beta-lyase/cystathionine gamma-synthase